MSAPAGSGKRRLVVLVADDDEDIRSLVSFDLEAEGFEVLQAHDGEAALAVALGRLPDLAVIDVVMPKLDGYEVTRRIRERTALDRTPVILLTARAQVSDIIRGFHVGADDYVTKPFQPDELRTRVRALVSLRSSPRYRQSGRYPAADDATAGR